MEKPIIYNDSDNMNEKLTILSSSADVNIGIYIVIGAAILAAIVLYLNFRRRNDICTMNRKVQLINFVYSVGAIKRNPMSSRYMTIQWHLMLCELLIKVLKMMPIRQSILALREKLVKEWFSRMGWGKNENLFSTYDKARYGAMTLTEEEGRRFVEDLNKIREKYLTDRS